MKKYLTIILTAIHQTGIAYAHHYGALTAYGIRGMNTGIDNLFEIGAGKENFEWG